MGTDYYLICDSHKIKVWFKNQIPEPLYKIAGKFINDHCHCDIHIGIEGCLEDYQYSYREFSIYDEDYNAYCKWTE